MAILGTEAGRTTQWFKDNKAALPAVAVLLGVAAFWVVGAVGGLGILHDANSPMAMLTGLYIGLAAVAVSIIVATLALNDLVSRYHKRFLSRDG